jgi:PAS domain S-box-containing protein
MGGTSLLAMAGNGRERRGGSRRIEDQLLQRLAKDSGEVLSVVDTSGVLTYVTPAAEKLFGWEGGELVGRQASRLFDADDFERLGERPRSSERRKGARLRIRHKNGSWRAIEARIQSLTAGPLDEKIGMVIFSRDVTDESTARRELRQSEQRLRELIDNAPIGISELSLDGRVLDANPEVCALLGYEKQTLIGMAADALVPAEDREARAEAMRPLMEGTVDAVTYEVSIETRDHRHVAAEVISTMLRNADGTPRSLLVLMQDVTERRKLEARVAEQADLINLTHDAIFVKTLADGAITFWNPAAAQLYGYTVDEALGRASTDLLRTEFPVAREVVEEKLTTTGSWSGELMHLTKAGEPVWVESRWALIRDRAGTPQAALEVNRDVTHARHLADERERLMAILERQNRELRETDQLKNEFLLTISHELRTPLTAILGFSDLLAMDSPIAERTELEIIQRNGRRLLSIIEDILTIAQVQAGDLRLRPRPLNVAGVVRRVAETERLLATEKGLQFHVVGTNEPAWAIADEMATSHVMRHLVGNAIKFTPTGEVVVTVKAEGDAVLVQVEDTGIGVPSEARELIFEDFRQVDQSVTRRYGGVGIGLSVVRKLVGLQGGTLGLEDRPGGGTRFWVTLPAERQEDLAPGQ